MAYLVRKTLINLVLYYITDLDPLLYEIRIWKIERKPPIRYFGVHKKATLTLNILDD